MDWGQSNTGGKGELGQSKRDGEVRRGHPGGKGRSLKEGAKGTIRGTKIGGTEMDPVWSRPVGRSILGLQHGGIVQKSGGNLT